MLPVVIASPSGADCPAFRALYAEGLNPAVLDTVQDLDYARGLARLWRSGEGFILVEHDVIPWPGSLKALWDCDKPWCGYRYPYGMRGQLTTRSVLGCVKVSASATRPLPDICEAWLNTTWQYLDADFERVMHRATGQDWFHVHNPPVAHARRREGWSA